MIKIIVSIFLLISTLFAQDYTLSSKYKISYGYFGTIGEAMAELIVEQGTYKIKVKAKTTGLVGVLTKHRVEIFESTGIVQDGHFVPDVFTESKKRGDRVNTKRYIFDHKNGLINLYSTNSRNKVLQYYTKNDLLSLFFNLKQHVGKDYNIKKPVQFIAVGANTKDGKVDIRSIGDNENEILEFFKKPTHLLSVTLNKKIFASKKGEMYIDLNDDGISNSAVLKDVLMFGDIKGELISHKKKEL